MTIAPEAAASLTVAGCATVGRCIARSGEFHSLIFMGAKLQNIPRVYNAIYKICQNFSGVLISAVFYVNFAFKC